jgi:DNA-binding FadR family transcriptional regulator
MESVAAALALLRKLLTSGDYESGDKLPTERELCARLGVSRRAVRKAISFLEAEGKIWRHVGRGTFVGGRPIYGTNDIDGIGHRTNPDEIMEVRMSLEPSIARLAALRATPSEIEHMNTCYRRCVSADTPEIYERWDSALHTTIAEASHNLLLIAVFNTINALRTDATWGQLRQNSRMRAHQKHYSEQHAAIIKAITNRDPGAAAERMSEHIATIRQRVLTGSLMNVEGWVADA